MSKRFQEKYKGVLEAKEGEQRCFKGGRWGGAREKKIKAILEAKQKMLGLMANLFV